MADVSISEIQKIFGSEIERCIEEATKRAKIFISNDINSTYEYKNLLKKKEKKSKHLYEQGYIIL
jgi:hypothetical protein